MPVLEKLKEEICNSSSSYIADGFVVDKDLHHHNNHHNQSNGSVVIDQHEHQNNVNNNYENLTKLTTTTTTKPSSNSSSSGVVGGATKLGFKKKMNGVNLKHKLDDPFRFSGDGVDFKAKLIGCQDVDEPRGDQMCQDAIQTCKAIVKRKGEHKQRIFFNISLEGLKIKEQTSGKILYTFPVSKVSFIAKDVSDNRAFGFVYGAAEDQHKFYGIKTEKTADHVVFSIRDMFQIVYEMKKKQIELAKQQKLQQKPQDDNENATTNGINKNGVETEKDKTDCEEVPVANLLDLETELENLEQGMQNMEKWTSLVDDTNENGLSQSPSSPPSGMTSDSSGWATTSLSSNAGLNESNDPFNDHLFTSSTNSFGSAGPVSKEAFVPPPPVSSNSRRASHPNGHSTLFGGGINDPFSSTNDDALLFENGGNSSSNVFVISKPGADDPFDTSHVVNKIIINPRNANLLEVHQGVGVTPLVVSTPLQPKSSSWLPNGHSSLLDSSSQCLSAIPPPSTGFEEHSVNGAFSLFNGSASMSKITESSSSIFNTAATDSSLFQTSNGVLHDSSSSVELSLLNSSNRSTTTTMTNGHHRNNHNLNGASPLSIPNSSGSQSPRSPATSKPNSLSRSLTKNSNGNIVDDAFAKLCNLDTLVITPSRSSPQQQTNGFLSNGNGVVVGTPPKRDDPFAHLKHRPKKTINELRELTAGPSLDGFENLLESSKTSDDTSSSPPSRPPIPPRSGQNFPAIPRPDGAHNFHSHSHNNNHNASSSDIHQRGLLPPPPPVSGAKFVEVNSKPHHDPFADEFFA